MSVEKFFHQVRTTVFLSLLPLTCIFIPATAKAANLNFDDIYVFGDSYSDTGNAYNASGSPSDPPYSQGRFSNGPLWVEDLATQLGVTYNKNNNYAFVGAGTGFNNPYTPQYQLTGVLGQIDRYKATKSAADPNALYTVWAGTTDYLFTGYQDPSQPVNNLSTAVQELANYGAKNILVVNLPDLGELPGVRGSGSANLDAVTSLHNSALAKTVNNLSQSLPSVHLTTLDVNHWCQLKQKEII